MRRALLVLLLAMVGCVIGPKPEDPAEAADGAATDTGTGLASDTGERRDSGGGIDAPFSADAAGDASLDKDGASDAGDGGDARTDAADGATDAPTEGG